MLIPVILSGGAGTRLWPVSRRSSPKPFMAVADGASLLARTFERARSLPRVSGIVTVTHRDHLLRTLDEYRHAEGGTFILEPVGRNTAPALTLAALQAQELYGDEAVLLVLPADHLIRDQAAFADDVAAAEALARKGFLVTFGIRPDRPEPGFGYIELGESIGVGTARASRFVEKPAAEVARAYLEAGTFVWNSGMFCFATGRLLEALDTHAPQLLEGARECWRLSSKRADFGSRIVDVDADSFAGLPDISVDFAVMEKAANVAVVAARFDWNDIGSWSAIHAAATGDARGNRIVGDVILVDVSNTYIRGSGRLVAAVGMDDMVIVDTPDALLVANRNRSQDVKRVVEELKRRHHESLEVHRTVARPWGTYTVLEEGPGFKIKRVVVQPGRALSLQFHRRRSEHWVVVSGTARITNGEEVFVLRTNESAYVPAGNKHRIENPGAVELVIIEVQSGDYLGEDDVVRLQDNFGRA